MWHEKEITWAEVLEQMHKGVPLSHIPCKIAFFGTKYAKAAERKLFLGGDMVDYECIMYQLKAAVEKKEIAENEGPDGIITYELLKLY